MTIAVERHRGGRPAARRRRHLHPDGRRPLALGALRRRGPAQVREPPAHRLVQDARRLHPHLPALATRSAPGVVAASAGNHAQGVALSAKLLGVKATVFMPEGAPIPKVNATMGYGADVVFHGQYLHHAMVAAHAFSSRDRRGADPPLRPRRHRHRPGHRPAWRSSRSRPRCGPSSCRPGAGDCSPGIAIAIKAKKPDVRIVGVQAKNAAAYPPSLAAGPPRPARQDDHDGRRHRGRRPGDLNFATIRDLVDEIITVTEESMARALLAVAERAKFVVEPSGAAAVAAMHG